MISLIVPTYNERQNVGKLVERAGQALEACGESYELIIVDDDSPDGTAEEVRRLQAGRPWLQLVARKNERDLSTAVLAGWRVARGDILGCMDGDLQHPPEQLARLAAALRSTPAEIAVASRYVEHGGVSDWKFRRRIISWTATLLAVLLLPSRLRRVRDPMSGFFLLKRSVVEGASLKPFGYKILLEVLARGRYTRAVEVPYVFEERAHGGSKMGPKQVWLYLLHLLRIWLDTGQAARTGVMLFAGAAGAAVGVAGLVWMREAQLASLFPAAFVAALTYALASFLFAELCFVFARARRQLPLGARLRFNFLPAIAGMALNTTVVTLMAGSAELPLVSAGLLGAIAALVANLLLGVLFAWEPASLPTGDQSKSAEDSASATVPGRSRQS